MGRALGARGRRGAVRAALIRAERRAGALGTAGRGQYFREVTRMVGVVPNAAYRHFADRDALLAAVRDAAVAQLAQRMADGMRQVPGAVDHKPPPGGGCGPWVRPTSTSPVPDPGLFDTAFAATEHHSQASSDDERRPFDHLRAALDGLVEAGLLAPQPTPDRRLSDVGDCPRDSRSCSEDRCPRCPLRTRHASSKRQTKAFIAAAVVASPAKVNNHSQHSFQEVQSRARRGRTGWSRPRGGKRRPRCESEASRASLIGQLGLSVRLQRPLGRQFIDVAQALQRVLPVPNYRVESVPDGRDRDTSNPSVHCHRAVLKRAARLTVPIRMFNSALMIRDVPGMRRRPRAEPRRSVSTAPTGLHPRPDRRGAPNAKRACWTMPSQPPTVPRRMQWWTGGRCGYPTPPVQRRKYSSVPQVKQLRA